MNNKNTTKILISIAIGVIVITMFIFIGINYSKDDTSLSIVEKKWITNNINNIINVNIFNDIPVYGYNGDGIAFDFLSKFTEEYNINFNKISYYSTDVPKYSDVAFKILNNDDKLSKADILLYQDNYVVIAKDNMMISDISYIDNVGVLDNDLELITNYLGNDKIISYKSIDLLINSLNVGNIKYIVIPNIMYMNKILTNNYNIVYHISDLNKKYVLSVKDNTVYNIMNKFYLNYKDSKYVESYSKAYLNIYFNSTNTSAVEQKNYNGKIYKYGFVVNMPYENYVDNKFVGTIYNYLKKFEDVSNTEIKAIKYNSIDELKNALVSGDVDFALTNFDYDNINMNNVTTVPFINENYVVLSNNNININSIKGLKGKNVSVVGSSNLYNLCNNNNIKTKMFANSDELIRNIDKNSIIIMDKDTYFYYRNVKLSNYIIIYEDIIKDGYKFIINSDNETFAKLFNYYINSNDYKNIRYNYNTNVSLEKDSSNVWFVLLLIGLIISVIVGLFYISKKRDSINNVSKDERLKFIDPITSLKNRNYLNHNIYNWDDNVIFPQSIIMLDVNNLRSINDRLGREAGDELIKKIASILIDNQLENTDIVRSGGDEFLIYMIGYDEDKTIEHAKKLTKLMKNVSHSEGVEYGYSMILDEVKTVDDAINESLIMLDKHKEKSKE